MRQRFIAALAAFLLIASSAFGQGKTFMWKVEGEGGSVAYLLGSLHVLTQESYPLNPTINKAFEGSKVLVEEVDIAETSDPAQMMAALIKAMLTDKTLDQVIAPATYAEVTKRAEQAGLPMMMVNKMKPWLVAITLTAPVLQNAGFKPELGIDQHFYDRAVSANMKRQALETLQYQLDRFDEMPLKMQEDFLKSTMEDLDNEVSGVKEMAQAWAFGNVAAVEKFALAGLKEAPELYQRLLIERNLNWMPQVEACF
jgi:uncharacterized protein YbaP (TraB family)